MSVWSNTDDLWGRIKELEAERDRLKEGHDYLHKTVSDTFAEKSKAEAERDRLLREIERLHLIIAENTELTAEQINVGRKGKKWTNSDLSSSQ